MKMRNAIHRRAGFTLLEVLIAVVVLSFGVLGMVGLQAASLQANRDARFQSAAARLGRELADMMRGNKIVATQTTAAANPYLFDTDAGAYPAPPENCFAQACTSPVNVASYEMREWLGRVGTLNTPGELPGARVVVCFDRDPFTSTGAPRWECDNAGGVAVIKIGWTRLSTNRAADGASAIELVSAATSMPTIVLPVTAGR